jgi:hypothetical protein
MVGFGVFFGRGGIVLFDKGELALSTAAFGMLAFCLAIAIIVYHNLAAPEGRLPPEPTAPLSSIHIRKASSDLVELMRSNDAVRLEAAKTLLTAHGVAVHLLDTHGSTMLGSLPTVTARLLVARPDLERSVEILTSVPEEDGSGDP